MFRVTGLTMDGRHGDTAQATYAVPAVVDHDDNVATALIPVTTVRFRVYSQTTDATKDPDVVLTSNSPDTSRTLTLLADTVTDPSTRHVTVALRTKRIPGRPQTICRSADAKRDGFGNVDLDWDAPETGTATTPSTVSGYRIDVSDEWMVYRGARSLMPTTPGRRTPSTLTRIRKRRTGTTGFSLGTVSIWVLLKWNPLNLSRSKLIWVCPTTRRASPSPPLARAR